MTLMRYHHTVSGLYCDPQKCVQNVLKMYIKCIENVYKKLQHVNYGVLGSLCNPETMRRERMSATR